MNTDASGFSVLLVPLVFLIGFAAPVRGQVPAPRAEEPSGRSVEVALAGGVSHVENSNGLTAIVGGGLFFRGIRLGLTPVDITWVSADPQAGYKRSYSIAGSILCQDASSNEFVDESHCDDVSARFGAMVDLAVMGFGGRRKFGLGGGYRVGAGRGPFLSLSWGPGSSDPSGSWYLQGRVGKDFLQGTVGLAVHRGGRPSSL